MNAREDLNGSTLQQWPGHSHRPINVMQGVLAILMDSQPQSSITSTKLCVPRRGLACSSVHTTASQLFPVWARGQGIAD